MWFDTGDQLDAYREMDIHDRSFDEYQDPFNEGCLEVYYNDHLRIWIGVIDSSVDNEWVLSYQQVTTVSYADLGVAGPSGVKCSIQSVAKKTEGYSLYVNSFGNGLQGLWWASHTETIALMEEIARMAGLTKPFSSSVVDFLSD